LTIKEALEEVTSLLKTAEQSNTPEVELQRAAEAISKKNGYEVKVLKKTFNRYSDNIFYSNKKEANLYVRILLIC
jgi:hypothetical protein